MTGELLLVAVVVGLLSGWLIGVVAGRGGHGWLGDLSLGLMGAILAVWSYQAMGLVAVAGTIGAIGAAGLGGIGLVLGERKVRYYLGT